MIDVSENILHIMSNNWKKKDNVPVTYNNVPIEFRLGERTIKPINPTVTLQAEGYNTKPVAFNTWEEEYSLKISFDYEGANVEESDQMIRQLVHQFRSFWLKHRIFWVMGRNPLDFNYPSSPLVYNNFLTILQPYKNQVIATLQSRWDAVHLTSTPYPVWKDSGVVTEALYLLLSDVKIGNTGTLTTPQIQACNIYNTGDLRPIRLLYNARMDNITPTADQSEKQFLNEGSVRLVVNEQVEQREIGPDNIIVVSKPKL